MKTKFPVPVLVIIGIIATATLLYAYNVNFPHYSDSKMETHFLSNEADFNRLVEMFAEDSDVDMIINNEVYAFEKTGEAMSKERLQEYQTLFDKTKVNYGIRRIGAGDVRQILLISTQNSDSPNEYYQSRTTAKGFVYSPKEPSPIVESLAGVQDRAHKKIKGNWYLYYTEGFSKPE